jgi:hypothetical protein
MPINFGWLQPVTPEFFHDKLYSKEVVEKVDTLNSSRSGALEMSLV